MIRLDCDYPAFPGDIDCAGSFSYEAIYKVVPGLTFEMCQEGKMTKQVEKEFKDAIIWLAKEKKVSGISSDCGAMMWFSQFARKYARQPVFMSALA